MEKLEMISAVYSETGEDGIIEKILEIISSYVFESRLKLVSTRKFGKGERLGFDGTLFLNRKIGLALRNSNTLLHVT